MIPEKNGIPTLVRIGATINPQSPMSPTVSEQGCFFFFPVMKLPRNKHLKENCGISDLIWLIKANGFDLLLFFGPSQDQIFVVSQALLEPVTLAT